jgi:hypothetical protein
LLRVCGSDAGPAGGAELFGASTLFLADQGEVARLEDGGLRARIAAALGDRDSIAWLDPGGALTVLPHDEHGRVVRRVDLPNGHVIPAGSSLSTAEAGPAAGGAGPPGVTVGLRGERAGVLGYEADADDGPSIRYFHPASGAAGGAIGALRFRLFAPGGARVDVRYDPARPHDPARSRALPTTATPQPSTFRTRWGAVVQLAPRPPHASYVWAYDPASGEAYVTLDGLWDWSVAGSDAPIALLTGLSGAEYVSAGASFAVRFVAGAPAFAGAFDPALAATATPPDLPLKASAPGVRQPVTTAWVYVEPPADQAASGGAEYFSQPEMAAMFQSQAGDPFLSAFDLRSAELPASATSPFARFGSFPAVPYAGLEPPAGASKGDDTRWLDAVRRFETEVLTPARTEAIEHLAGPAGGPRGIGDRLPAPRGASGPTGPAAITPQGLLSTFSQDRQDWRSLVVAQAQRGTQQLTYTNLSGKLRQALLATEPFVVVSDVKKLLDHCSTTYCVTSETLGLAGSLGKVPDGALAQARAIAGQVYSSADGLDAALAAVLSADNRQYAAAIRVYAELAELTVAGWTFDLATWRWRTGDSPTMLVFAFADGDFASLVDDRSRWTLPGEFNAEGGKEAQKLLKATIADARRRVATEPDLRPFVDTVLATDGAAWHGVLYLNVPVPANAFPPELEALAAGLDPTELFAHHLGVTITSFRAASGRIALDDSALFGLILYEDPTDLVFHGDAYDFKVTSLKVLFANSTIAAFSSQVELMVGRLFAELAQLGEYGAHGPNNIVLEGTLQHGAFRFASTARSHFELDSRVVEFVDVERAELVTLTSQSTAHHVAARFLLEGAMGFRRLGEFDLFGFGPGEKGEPGQLAFSNMLVTMEFDPSDPKATRKLSFVAGQMNLDPSRSTARAGSLPRRFPLQVAAMRDATTAAAQAAAKPGKPATPADLGFIPVESPLTPGDLGPEWFGLELALSFGSPGGLASSLGLTGALLASWAPSAQGYDVAVGLRLPGSGGGRKSLTIMGPLNLSIGRLSFLYDTDTSGYLLSLQNMALSFLGLSFPPGGKTNAMLFGDPDPQGANPALGWYAAYLKDKDPDGGDPAKELPWPA